MELATTKSSDDPPRPKYTGFKKGVSANPAGRRPIKTRVNELFDGMVVDFGELAATDVVLLKQACLLIARSEAARNIKDADICLRMTGEARRILSALRRHAPPKSAPSLYERLASAQRAGDDAADAAATGDAAEPASASDPAGGTDAAAGETRAGDAPNSIKNQEPPSDDDTVPDE
jgi:hypothetical protein